VKRLCYKQSGNGSDNQTDEQSRQPCGNNLRQPDDYRR
jgi:hypothetical protein